MIMHSDPLLKPKKRVNLPSVYNMGIMCVSCNSFYVTRAPFITKGDHGFLSIPLLEPEQGHCS